ncbi:MAG: hypothetical protein J7496_08535 [Novosphingobium sp.]|nr:hypothetical protein [Novosphingobium sp.]
MTDIATLAMKIDSTEVPKGAAELDKLAAAGARAEQATTDLAAAQAQSKTVLSTYKTLLAEGSITQEQYNAAILRTKADLSQVEAEYRRAAAALNVLRSEQDGVTKASGAMQAGLHQAGFQVSDFFVQIGSGTGVIRAASQQIPQLVQAMSIMGAGADEAGGKFAAFAKFMSGGWGIAITVGVSVLGALANALLQNETKADDTGVAIKDLAQQFDFAKMSADELRQVNDLLAGSLQQVERTAIGAANASYQNAKANREAALAALDAAEAEYARISAFSKDPTFAEGSVAFGGYLTKSKANIDDIKALRTAIVGFGQEANKAYFNVQTLTAGLDANGKKAEKLRSQIDDLRLAYQRSGDPAQLQQALALEGQLSALEERRGRKKKEQLSDEEKAYRKAYDAAADYIASLGDQISKTGLSEKEVRVLTSSRAADAAATKGQADTIRLLSERLEKVIADQEYYNELLKAKQQTANLRDELDQLDREAKAVGLVGWERERLLLILENEAKIRPLVTEQVQAEFLGQTALSQELQKQIDLLNGITRAKVDQGNLEDGLKKEKEAAEDVNRELEQMISLLNQVGGFGSVLGGLLGIASGNYSSIGGGALGGLISFVLSQKTGSTITKDGKQVAELLGDKLEKVFSSNGVFGQTLKENLQSAGLGYAGATAVLGQQGTAGSIGSSIGGVIGEAAGKKFLGFLGDFAGPIGSIAGGILGGLIGGLFGSTPKGSATISGTSVISTSGKGDQLANSEKSADSIIDSLNQIAEALGGTVQAVAGVSVGMRGSHWRVDTTGQGNTKMGDAGVVDFGSDAEGAAMYAMKLLIERGVIGGIRASTQNVLTAGSDLEAQINKALKWESVLKEAEQASSPFAQSLKDLSDQFAEINEIAIEAKASTAELAEVQGLLVQKQQELIDQASANYRATFYTTDQNVAYAKKTISDTLTPLGYGTVDTVAEYTKLVAATDPLKDPALYGALMDLSDEFGVLKDASDQAAQAAEAQAAAEKALAQQRASIEAQILQAQGKDAEALAKQRQNELDAADESLRPLLKKLYKAQDIATAKDKLSEAYQRESSALQDVIDTADKAVSTLTDFRDSLTSTGDTTQSVAALWSKFVSNAMLANTGDATAIGNFSTYGKSYLDAKLGTATSYVDYQRAVGAVAAYTNDAIAAAQNRKSVAEQQLDEMKTQVGVLIDINDNLLSVGDAIDQLNALLNPSSSSGGSSSSPDSLGGKLDAVKDRLRDLFDLIGNRADRSDRFNSHSADRLDALYSLFKAITLDGTALIVATDADTPLNTVSV